jgi:hypothetical protein
LLFSERYVEGGWFKLTPHVVANLSLGGGALLGKATRANPFRVRQEKAENQVVEWAFPAT